MIIGFVGAGNMAAAMARGWAGEGDSMLFSDAGSGRATALAAELGGETAANAEIAARADVVVVAVKPAKLDDVAPELGAAREIVSILAAVPLERLREAFPGAEAVLRVMPNVGVEVRQGVLCVSGEASDTVRARLEALGRVVDLADADFDAATAVMSCSPAFLALAVEALADAGTVAGLDADLSRSLVVETSAGTAALLRAHSPAEVRSMVASPGGATEAGLDALARVDLRGDLAAGVEASLEKMRR
jgi:pyrroline-5-carboxylate reductase